MKKLNNNVEKEIIKRVKKIRKYYKYHSFVSVILNYKSSYCDISFYTTAVSPNGIQRKELMEILRIYNDGTYHQEYMRDFFSLYFEKSLIDFFALSSILKEAIEIDDEDECEDECEDDEF